MTDALNEARAALKRARDPKTLALTNHTCELLVQVAIASALIALTQEVAKIGLLLKQRMPK